MYLSYKTFPKEINDRDDTYEWYSEMYLSDSIVMCNQQGDGLAAPNSDHYAGYYGMPMWANTVRCPVQSLKLKKRSPYVCI